MVFARITGTIIILFGIFIGLTYFNVTSGTFGGYNLVVVGILLFILHETYVLIMNFSSDTNKIISLGVPLLFIIISGSYFVRESIPGAIALVIPIVTAALMIAEGLYRLH